MGNAIIDPLKSAASLEAFLIFGQHDEIVEKRINCKLVNATIPSEEQFPDYGRKLTGTFANLNFDTSNRNYYRENAKYHQEIWRMRGFKIGIKNSGEIPARDVKVIFEIAKDSEVSVVSKTKVPEKPRRDSLSSAFMPHKHGKISDVFVKNITDNGWRITCLLGKIQPKDMVITEEYFCLSATKSSVLQINGQIFSDDLPEPKNEILEVGFEVEDRVFTVDDFLKNEKF